MKQEISKDHTYDRVANTRIEHQIQNQPVRNYIKFQYSQNEKDQILTTTSEDYEDQNFSIDVQRLQQFGSGEEIVLKRISHIFHKSFSPPLFPWKHSQKMKAVKSHQKVYPHFVYELRHFDVFTFQRLFITQEINFQGKYSVLVNNDGKFEVQTVDDLMPLYKNDNSSIWQLDIQQPWQLIVAKIWAKKVRGYHNIPYTKPFEFIQYFTPSNWKYLNLYKQGRNFLSNYFNKVGTTCRILLKTKTEGQVQRCGLISGEIAYELTEFVQYKEKNKQEFFLVIQSTAYHSWAGNMSIFDSQFRPVFEKLKQNFKLETNFMINQSDFFNIFSSAYVTSCNRPFPQYINSLELSSQNKNPFLIRFQLKQNGFFLYNLVQRADNVQYLDTSQLQNNSYLSYIIQQNCSQLQFLERYLKVKILLSKQNQLLNSNQPYKHNIAYNSIRSTKMNEMDLILKYHLVDFDYQKGYNKGDSHPLMLEAGNYLLQVFPENVSKQSHFVFQCISHEPIQLHSIKTNLAQSLPLLKEGLMSIIQQMPCQPLQNEHNGFISFGNEFSSIGFGFVAVIFYKRPFGRLTISLDLYKLQQQGYHLLEKQELKKKVLNVTLSGGQFHMFILSKYQDGRKVDQYIWPPTSFKYILFSK